MKALLKLGITYAELERVSKYQNSDKVKDLALSVHNSYSSLTTDGE